MPWLVPDAHEPFGAEDITLGAKKRAALESQAARRERPRFAIELRRSNSIPDRSSAKTEVLGKPELPVVSAAGFYRSNFRRAQSEKRFDLEFA